MASPDPGPALTLDDVRHVAALCRIGMTDAELERMRAELADLLDEVAFVQSVDTAGVEPTGHAVDNVHSVMRDDEPGAPMAADDVLLNAPLREGVYFRTRSVLD